MARKPWTREMTGESMTVTGTEVRDEVAKVCPTTARAVIGQRAITGTRFFPKKSRRVARVAERVERAGAEVERETERWQRTKLMRRRAQPSGGETIVTILSRIEPARLLAKYSYQLTLNKYFDRGRSSSKQQQLQTADLLS